jgi:hypothetical protein
MASQSNWRFCVKCNSLLFNGYSGGKCPAGGRHARQQGADYNFVLPYNGAHISPDETQQDEKFKLIIAINVSSVGKKGNVQVSDGPDGNPGHTFVAIKDSSNNVVKILSYGTVKRPGTSLDSIACFGPGTAYYHLLSTDDFYTYEWYITKEQADRAIKKIGEIETSSGTYSSIHRCTTVALEVTDAAGMTSMPRGKGNIDIPLCDDALNVSTPYNLDKYLMPPRFPF